ncbi:MAG: hypothetical protein H6713_34990 [Myxococcales bacterium]|nr:hypothetical protein [Myxococcales bacterium]
MATRTLRLALMILLSAPLLTACDGGKKDETKPDEKAKTSAPEQPADAKTAEGDAKSDDAKAEDKGPEAVVPTDPSKAGGAPVPVM